MNKTRIAVLISGGLSGIGGMCFAYSLLSQYSPSIYLGYGYLAIAAMIFGNWNILSTFFVCIFFGLARAGGQQLCLAMGLASVYTDLFNMIPYILTLLLLMFFSQVFHPKMPCFPLFFLCFLRQRILCALLNCFFPREAFSYARWRDLSWRADGFDDYFRLPFRYLLSSWALPQKLSVISMMNSYNRRLRSTFHNCRYKPWKMNFRRRDWLR